MGNSIAAKNYSYSNDFFLPVLGQIFYLQILSKSKLFGYISKSKEIYPLLYIQTQSNSVQGFFHAYGKSVTSLISDQVPGCNQIQDSRLNLVASWHLIRDERCDTLAILHSG